MSNKSLMLRANKSIMASESLSGAAGKGMVVAGGGTLAVYFLTALVPFIGSPFLLAFILIGLGLFMWE